MKGTLSRLLLTLPFLSLPAVGEVLVNLDATSATPGTLATWTNTGTLAGNFVASGSPISPDQTNEKARSLLQTTSRRLRTLLSALHENSIVRCHGGSR